MLTKEQTFELYIAMKEVNKTAIIATYELTNKEAQEKHSKAYKTMLELLRKNCKEDFSAWPDEV